MKRLIAVLIFSLLFTPFAWADPSDIGPVPPAAPTMNSCERYPTIVDEWGTCLGCHKVLRGGKLGMKDVSPYERYDLGFPLSAYVSFEADTVPVLEVGEVEYKRAYEMVVSFFQWVAWHPEIKHVVFNIFSPGGSLFDASAIITEMDKAKSRGVVVETRVYGFAASAAFTIFVNGSDGHRVIGEMGELMWHELWTFKFFDVSSPSDKEEEARVLRHLQDTIQERIAKRGKLSKEELDEKIRKKEFWMNGPEAVEYGFADKLVK